MSHRTQHFNAVNGLRERDFSGATITSNSRRVHRTDDRNQIGSQLQQGVADFDNTPPSFREPKFAYDRAGRMLYDGRVLYDHDAFGRLVQARRAPSDVIVHGDGTMVVPNPGSIGELVAHYSYDGLGRVIRTQRPTSTDTTPQNSGTLIVTDLYYDGVRVVQEVGWGGSATTGGGSGVPVRARRDASNNALNSAPGLPRRANEMTGSNVTWEGCAPTTQQNAGGWVCQDRRLQREYVWAGDSAAYVDENVAQLVYTKAHVQVSGTSSGDLGYRGDDSTATVLYTLADHNANVIGLTDDRGRLVGQFSYTTYGELRAAKYIDPDSGSLASAEAVTGA